MNTVSDLREGLYNHPDAGVALTIQNAINHAIEKKGLTANTILDMESLEKIRQSIYDLNDAGREGVNPMMMFVTAMMSAHTAPVQSSGNTVEDALRYIEGLMKEKRLDSI